MSTLVEASPELKSLWIRVLKRVHPDLAVDEQDRRRCEQLAQQANEAYARGDEAALRAVLEPKRTPPPPGAWEATAQDQHETSAGSIYQAPPVPQQPRTVSRHMAFGILWAACGVLCLLLYGIFDALSEQVGRSTSITFLAMITAAVLWLITKNSRLSYNHKARWMTAIACGVIFVAICLLDTSRPRATRLFPSANAATADALASPVSWRGSDHLSPSQWYWGVIRTRVGQSWNPSAVVNTPAGAIADIAFTISRDGSPHDVQLRRPSGYRSFDASCVLAVQQVKTFGPPEGGIKDSLRVLYPCSYRELDSLNAHLPQSKILQKEPDLTPTRPATVTNPGEQLGGYLEGVKSEVTQKWNPSEVAGNTPEGATVYIQFAIQRLGHHEAPKMETSSGYSSLDVSCLHAVEGIKTFDHLPRGYAGDSLTVLYHCTYSGSPTKKTAQDSNQPQAQQPPSLRTSTGTPISN
ncbi:MAG: TonB family protein [Acidobacteriaceae bacterium]